MSDLTAVLLIFTNLHIHAHIALRHLNWQLELPIVGPLSAAAAADVALPIFTNLHTHAHIALWYYLNWQLELPIVGPLGAAAAADAIAHSIPGEI